MQEIRHFGSVIVMITECGQRAVVCSTRPDELHEHEQDWNDAMRFIIGRGFEPPADDPDSVSPLGVEVYSVQQAASRLTVVGA